MYMVYKDCWELTSLHYKHVCCNGTMLGFTAKIVKSHCGTNKNVKEKDCQIPNPSKAKNNSN